jgi:hypothetical protein
MIPVLRGEFLRKVNLNMKVKTGVFAFLTISALLFNSCDLLYGDENNGQQIVGVEPLTQTQWWQYSPYNDLFPMASEGYTLPVDNTGRTLTDCSNAALAQILYYHKHPKQGIGQSTKLWPMHFYGQTGDVYVNLEVLFDWDNMLNSYPNTNSGTETQRKAVATLMYHTAAAMGAADGSLHRALVNILGYDRSIQIHHRSFYTDIEWEAVIRKQLDLRLPVYYSGIDPQGSHNFVVDGYDNNGRFHINWGWEGRHDGWYSLDNLNPIGERRYYNNQFIVINIKPDDGGVSSDYVFGLTAFIADKTSASQNELLTVTPTITSFCFFSGGQAGVALVNNNGGIAAVIGTRNMGTTWQPGSRAAMEMNCFIPETVNPGQYRLMAVTRIEGGEWKIITVSAENSPTSIGFEVR